MFDPPYTYIQYSGAISFATIVIYLFYLFILLIGKTQMGITLIYKQIGSMLAALKD